MIKRDVGRLLALGARPTQDPPCASRVHARHSRSRVSRSKTATRCIIRASTPEIRDTLRVFRAWSRGNDHFSSPSPSLPSSHPNNLAIKRFQNEHWRKNRGASVGGIGLRVNDVSTGIRTCLFFLLLLLPPFSSFLSFFLSFSPLLPRLTLESGGNGGVLRYFYWRFTRRCRRQLYRGKFLRRTG